MWGAWQYAISTSTTKVQFGATKSVKRKSTCKGKTCNKMQQHKKHNGEISVGQEANACKLHAPEKMNSN